MAHIATVTGLTRAGLDAADAASSEISRTLTELLAVQRKILDLLTGRCKSHYSVEEIAELVGRSAFTIRRWISAGRIHAVRVDGTGPRGRLLIARDQLEALVSTGLGASIPDAAVDDQAP